MKIALIFAATNAVLQVWYLAEGEEELAIRYTLPDGNQLSPIKPGWAKNGYFIVAVTEFEVPEGKVTKGPPSYALVDGEVVETYTVEDFRPMVRKSTVQARLIAAGKMGDAYAALTTSADHFARWFAPDQPRVYCDDADSVAFLVALGLDPEVFLAPEEA